MFSGFKDDFSNSYRLINQNKNPKFSLWSKTFFTLCDRARQVRQPILVLVVQD